MTEFYRDSVGLEADLSIPSATVTQAVFKRDGVETIGQVSGTTVSLPYAITHMDGPFQIEWTYTVEGSEYKRVDSHEIITPLFVKADLAYDTALATLSDDQVVKLESIVRKVIESYTGQRFGYREGSVSAYGNGSGVLNLPERLISLDTTLEGFRPVNEGFGLSSMAYPNPREVNIKVPASEEAYHYGRSQVFSFTKNVQFIVTGKFGWESVPADVKEAALLLAEDLSCDESMWRDRYIKAIRAADWRFDFADGAYQGTGSLAADNILGKYVVNKAVVI